MANNIDFSIIREHALRNIREDLLTEFAGQFDALEINDAFELMHEGKSIRTVIHF